jgi:hypothetical protein
VVAAVWLAVAAVVGVLIGRMIRKRDRQVPSAPTPPPPTDSTTGEDDPTRRVPGRGRRRP